MVIVNLPHATAPFVNRVQEIETLTQRLNDANCRLLTLIGPGGIGKTRLAVQIATRCIDQFDDGIYFVPLQSLDSPEFIVSAIADALHFHFSAGAEPKQQLFHYLHGKTLLLLLDNFEHLLEGATLLSDLLAAAPDLKLLTTSREVMNLQEEWLFPVQGLHYPETTADKPGTYSAVQLFVERARQVRSDLSLTDEQAGITRICQLVEGMPLALELAAVWAKALRIDEIALEIQRNLDFLSTSLRNVPQRHQSMQAVFEQTWGWLSDEERRVFSALSVFNGGFRREAAQEIACVTPRILAGLVDKSLLTREPNGRYQIHSLLRQYARTHLQANPDVSRRVHESHAAYYAQFLHARDTDLNGGRQRESSQEIQEEIDNIRAAWSWSLDHAKVENIAQSIHPLSLFFSFQSRFAEGIASFEKAVQMLDNGDPNNEINLASALCELGWMYARGGVVMESTAALARSWQLYAQHTALPIPGQGSDPRAVLGFLMVALDTNVDVATQLLEAAYRDHTERQDRYNLALTGNFLAATARWQGRFEDAMRYIQPAYEHTVATGDSFTGAYVLQEWGVISQSLGNLTDSKRRLQACYDIQKDFGDLNGMHHTLQKQGTIAASEGDHAQARHYHEQALGIAQNLGDFTGMASALANTAVSALAQRQFREVTRYSSEALQIAVQHKQAIHQLPYFCVSISDLFLQTGKHTQGSELLALILRYPSLEHTHRERAQRLVTLHQLSIDESAPASTLEDFEAIALVLLDELQRPDANTLTRHSPYADDSLIEPLTEREIEILKLIADGLSNRQIADQLFLTVGTVKWYTSRMFSKLGVQSRTLAIVRARQLNLLS